MVEEIKEENATPSKRIIAESVGRYIIIDSTKIYEFIFPVQNSIEENLKIVNYMKEEIEKVIDSVAKKKEEEKKAQE